MSDHFVNPIKIEDDSEKFDELYSKINKTFKQFILNRQTLDSDLLSTLNQAIPEKIKPRNLKLKLPTLKSNIDLSRSQKSSENRKIDNFRTIRQLVNTKKETSLMPKISFKDLEKYFKKEGNYEEIGVSKYKKLTSMMSNVFEYHENKYSFFTKSPDIVHSPQRKLKSNKLKTKSIIDHELKIGYLKQNTNFNLINPIQETKIKVNPTRLDKKNEKLKKVEMRVYPILKNSVSCSILKRDKEKELISKLRKVNEAYDEFHNFIEKEFNKEVIK